MFFKYLVKKSLNTILPLADSMNIGSITRERYGGIGHILMLHRVLPESKSIRIHNHQTLEISPYQLEQTILFFRRKGYAFIQLDELASYLLDKNPEGRFCILTFDDGYRDNLIHAYPILKKYGIPFTIYVSTDFCDRKAFIWWYILEDLLIKEDKLNIRLGSANFKYSMISRLKKEYIFEKIRSAIMKLQNLDELEAIFNRFGLYRQKYQDEFVLNWKELIHLSKDTLTCIGSHTVNHSILPGLNDAELLFQLTESKNRIEKETGKIATHFCYPAGRFGPREIEMVRKCGYVTSTTCVISNLFPHHLQELLYLPRIPINSYVSEKYLNLVTTGILPALANRWLRSPSII